MSDARRPQLFQTTFPTGHWLPLVSPGSSCVFNRMPSSAEHGDGLFHFCPHDCISDAKICLKQYWHRSWAAALLMEGPGVNWQRQTKPLQTLLFNKGPSDCFYLTATTREWKQTNCKCCGCCLFPAWGNLLNWNYDFILFISKYKESFLTNIPSTTACQIVLISVNKHAVYFIHNARRTEFKVQIIFICCHEVLQSLIRGPQTLRIKSRTWISQHSSCWTTD